MASKATAVTFLVLLLVAAASAHSSEHLVDVGTHMLRWLTVINRNA
jgi:hypothetical protein